MVRDEMVITVKTMDSMDQSRSLQSTASCSVTVMSQKLWRNQAATGWIVQMQ